MEDCCTAIELGLPVVEVAAGKDGLPMIGSSKAVNSSSRDLGTLMHRSGPLWLTGTLVAVLLLSGCHTDPNVRKQKYFESGMRFSNQGKYNEAAIQFANALKIDGNFANAHFELAHIYMHLGRYSGAFTEFSRTVALQPSNLKARIDLGGLLLAGGKVDEAQAQATAVMAVQPNNPDLHALLSGIALKRGQKDEAKKEIQRAMELDPNRAVFHEDYAILIGSDPSQAATVESELKKAVSLDPKAINIRLILAAFYASDSRWPESEQTIRDAIATDPKNLQARQTLAKLFLQQGNTAKAEEVLRQTANDLAPNPQAARVLADYYETFGQYDKARAEFAVQAAKYPKDLPMQEGYLRSLLQVKDYTTAKTVVAALMKRNGRDPQVRALNGIVMLNDGRADDAVNALQSAARDYPKDASIQFWLGKAALARGDFTLAETSFRNSAVLEPARLDAQQELAILAVQHGDMDLLLEVADNTIKSAPHFPGGYVWRAVVELARNKPELAEPDLKTAIAIAPKSAPAYLQLGKIRFMQKKYPEAVSLLEQNLQYDPNSIEAMRLLIGYDLYQKQLDKALARVNQQIAIAPKNSSLYVLLAELQIQSNKLDLAAVSAQKAMQLNSGDVEAVMVFAQIKMHNGQTANAISAWEQWIKQHPNDAASIAILGTLEESAGNKPKAEELYKKALGISPQQPLAANNLAYMMLQNGENSDVALSLAQTARRAMPNSNNTADTLAWAYYTKGVYGFARDLLEDGLKTDPNNAAMQYHLGMVYAKLQNKANAATHFKKAISLLPESQTAKDAKAALQGLG